MNSQEFQKIYQNFLEISPTSSLSPPVETQFHLLLLGLTESVRLKEVRRERKIASHLHGAGIERFKDVGF